VITVSGKKLREGRKVAIKTPEIEGVFEKTCKSLSTKGGELNNRRLERRRGGGCPTPREEE